MIVHSRMCKHPDFRYSDPLSGCIPTFNLKKYGHARYRGKGEGRGERRRKRKKRQGRKESKGGRELPGDTALNSETGG